MTNNHSNIIQLLIAGIVVLAGIALLFVGISYDPQGEIHETVLVAFGEAATFAGSIMGIDYHYKRREGERRVARGREASGERTSGRESGLFRKGAS